MLKWDGKRGLMIAALALIALISAAHWATGVEDVVAHNALRRLYYVPVVLGAFAYGVRGGLAAALGCAAAYVPHAFLMVHHLDPAPAADKGFEIALYLVVGALAGLLVDRERAGRERAERALAERNELERQLVRAGKLGALGELLAGVAHEVRNPLASIMGAAEGLERAARGDERMERLIELQLRETRRLDRVVSNFLAFARDEPPRMRSCEARALVDEVIELARHKGAEGTFEVEPGLDAARVWVDRDQASQVLLNLTLNAIEASAPLPYRVSYLYEERVVAGRRHDCVGVRDRGPGVPEAIAERVFEPYFTTRASGSGLGLSISSRVASSHGGFLDLASDPGGATFWFCVPGRAGRGAA